MNILKHLFCSHNYEYSRSGSITYKEPDFSGDGYNTWVEHYTEYICTKCGKKKKIFK